VNKVTIPEIGVGGGITWAQIEPSKVLSQINIQIDDFNKRVVSLKQEETDLNNRWKSYINSQNEFVGNDTQYAKYKREADDLGTKFDRLNREGSALDKKQKSVIDANFVTLPDGTLESKDATKAKLATETIKDYMTDGQMDSTQAFAGVHKYGEEKFRQYLQDAGFKDTDIASLIQASKDILKVENKLLGKGNAKDLVYYMSYSGDKTNVVKLMPEGFYKMTDAQKEKELVKIYDDLSEDKKLAIIRRYAEEVDKTPFEILSAHLATWAAGEKGRITPGSQLVTGSEGEAGSKWVGKATDYIGIGSSKVTNWAINDPNDARRFFKSIPVGLTEMVLGLTGALLTGVKGAAEVAEAKPKAALATLAAIPIGVASWAFVEMPKSLVTDPVSGIPRLAGQMSFGMVIHPKTAGAAFRKAFKVKEWSPDSIRVEVSMPGGTVPTDMPSNVGLALSTMLEDAMTTKKSRLVTDQVLVDPTSGATMRVTPITKGMKFTDPNADMIVYSSVGERAWLLDDFRAKGEHTVEVPRKQGVSGHWGKGEYATDSAWIDRGVQALVPGQTLTLIAYKIKRGDLRTVPADVQKLYNEGKIDEARARFIELEAKGELPTGVYETWKIVKRGDSSFIEREYYISKGTTTYPIKPTWYTKTREIGDVTASHYVKATKDYEIQVRDAAGNLVKNADGTIKTAVIIKKGDTIPIVYAAVEGAKRVAPNLLQRQLTEFVFEPYTAIKRMTQLTPQVKFGYGGVELPGIAGVKLGHVPNIYDYAKDFVEAPGREVGLRVTKTGGKGSQAASTVLGDRHENPYGILEDINSGYDKPIIMGNSMRPNTWHLDKGNIKKLGIKQITITQIGDILDGRVGKAVKSGPMYWEMRDAFNRLTKEAKGTKGTNVRVVRLIGNHELAYLRGEKIRGVDYANATNIRQSILDDIKDGYLVPAAEASGQLFTHAGVSLKKFPEWKGKSAAEISQDINARFAQGMQTGNLWGDKIFHIGRSEKGIGTYDRSGIFWLREGEALPWELDLGFKQFRGHDPHRSAILENNRNFVNVDVGAKYAQKAGGAYHDTPFATMLDVRQQATVAPSRALNLDLSSTESKAVKAIQGKFADYKFVDWIEANNVNFGVRTLTHVTPKELAAINRIVTRELNNMSPLGFKGITGIPNMKDPSQLVMPISKDSIGAFNKFQDRVQVLLKKEGLPSESIILEPHIVIGELKGNVPLKTKMRLGEYIMQHQPKQIVKVRVKDKTVTQTTPKVEVGEISEKTKLEGKTMEIKSREVAEGGGEKAESYEGKGYRGVIQIPAGVSLGSYEKQQAGEDYKANYNKIKEYAIPSKYANYIPAEYVAPKEYAGKYVVVDYVPSGYKPFEEIPTEYIPTKYIPAKYIPSKYIPSDYIPVKYIPTEYIPEVYTHSKYLPIPIIGRGGSGDDLEIERVEGIPRNPGIVVYDMGFSRIKAKPPFRQGTKDIEFEHLKTPTKGKGSEQASLRVYDGDAPQKLILRHGWKRTSILRGEELTNTIIKPRGRGTVIGLDGRVRKSRKKGILR
jgi:hypothetical protein